MKINLMSAFAALSLIAAGSAMAATATKENNPPAPAAKSAAPTTPISARDVPDAKNTLSSAKIVDLTGASVGSVDTVNLDPMGKPISFKVDVGGWLGIGTHDVALDANSLKWDPAKKVLITSMSKDQMKALPEIKG